MNYNKEPYPRDLNQLIIKAHEIAANTIERLNHENCPILFELYYEQFKTCGVKPEHSIIRDKKVFNDLVYLPNIVSGKSKSLNEFKGLYIFGEEHNGKVIPVYVGISRVVYKRLRNHAWGKTANTATLAFLMAKNIDTSLKANNRNINDLLIPQKEVIKKYKVHLIPVKEDYDLYFLEVAIAGILKTKWNSFRTH